MHKVKALSKIYLDMIELCLHGKHMTKHVGYGLTKPLAIVAIYY